MSDKKREYYPDESPMSAREQAIDSVASSIGVYDEGLCEEMLALGFDGDTAPFIGFIPMIQVAWADGVVDDKEQKKLRELSTARGVQEGTKEDQFIQGLISKRPSDDFFKKSNEIIRRILAKFPEDIQATELETLSDFCVAVAAASGGVMGMGNKISKEERELMREIAAELQTDNSIAGKDLLKKLTG